MSDGCAIEAALGQSEKAVQQRSALRTLLVRYWGEAIIVALALLVWVPRLSGPIDLRWDGGVYYLLGTSLAQGHGYRIPSEPGSPEALQYPPLLPAVVALHQRALGTTNVDTVAPWLRKSYAMTVRWKVQRGSCAQSCFRIQIRRSTTFCFTAGP